MKKIAALFLSLMIISPTVFADDDITVYPVSYTHLAVPFAAIGDIVGILTAAILIKLVKF